MDEAIIPGPVRLTAVAGDGQVLAAGSTAREPLVAAATDSTGVPSAGATVAYSRISGRAEVLGASGLGGQVADARATDQIGEALLDLKLPWLPDATVVLASLPPDQVVAFRIVSRLENEEIIERIADGLAQAARDDTERRASRAFVRNAIRRLKQDWLSAIRDLVAVTGRLDATPWAATTFAGDAVSAPALARRLLNQAWLLGPAPLVPDDEPIDCDIPLTRTIAAVDEIDRFRFASVAGERLHVTIGGAIGGFNPQWRLLGPDSNPVAGCDSFSTSDRECTLPLAGAHAIEVEDGGFNATGTYSLQIQRLTTSERCGTAISCDVPATTTIIALADTDLHQFSAVAGEKLHITIGGAIGGFNPQWRLLGPDSNPVAGCDSFSTSERECTLPLAGAHAIEVEDGGFNATGTYSLQIQRLTTSEWCGTAISCDVPATTTIIAVADTDLHQFSAVAGEKLHITIGGAIGGFNPQWRLLGPDSNPVTGCDTFSTSERECTLPLAGAHAIEVEDGGFNATGTYSLQIQRLTTSERCGTAISCDVPATTTIIAVADTDLHQFSAVAGEKLHITIGGAIGGFNPQWRLLGPDSNPVAGCDSFSTSERECTLPLAGAHAIEVEDGGFNATGTYSLQIQRLTTSERCGTAISCDVPATTTISALADTDLHQFNAVAGEVLHVTIGGAIGGFNPQWRLLGPDANAVAGCDTFSTSARDCTLPLPQGCGPLISCTYPPIGYAIEVEDGGFNATGTYSIHLQHLTAPRRCGAVIPCDVGVTTTISATADTDLFEFTGYPNEAVHIAISGGVGGFDPQWRLLTPNGTAVVGCDAFSGAARDCTLPVSGPYAIEVQDGSWNATGTYHLTVTSSLQVCLPVGTAASTWPPAWLAGAVPDVLMTAKSGAPTPVSLGGVSAERRLEMR